MLVAVAEALGAATSIHVAVPAGMRRWSGCRGGWPWPIHGPVPPGDYPDLPGLIDQLHCDGLKVLGYLNPFLVPGRPGFDVARERGYLVRDPDGSVFTEPWMNGDRRAYLDFTSPQAVAWWQDRVRHALGRVGFDGAMQDYGAAGLLDRSRAHRPRVDQRGRLAAPDPVVHPAGRRSRPAAADRAGSACRINLAGVPHTAQGAGHPRPTACHLTVDGGGLSSHTTSLP